MRLDLPAADGVPARSVTARLLDAEGEPGRGLTSARFSENVEFREDGQRGAPARVARSRNLRTTLVDALRPGLSFEDAAEHYSALLSPELFHLLIVVRGWDRRRYEAWTSETLGREFLG